MLQIADFKQTAICIKYRRKMNERRIKGCICCDVRCQRDGRCPSRNDHTARGNCKKRRNGVAELLKVLEPSKTFGISSLMSAEMDIALSIHSAIKVGLSMPRILILARI